MLKVLVDGVELRDAESLKFIPPMRIVFDGQFPFDESLSGEFEVRASNGDTGRFQHATVCIDGIPIKHIYYDVRSTPSPEVKS